MPFQHPVLYGQSIAENPQNKMMNILHYMNKVLADTGYLARTEAITVADLAAYATVSTISATEVVDLGSYDHLETWRRNCMRTIPNYEKANGNGIGRVVRFYKEQAKHATDRE